MSNMEDKVAYKIIYPAQIWLIYWQEMHDYMHAKCAMQKCWMAKYCLLNFYITRTFITFKTNVYLAFISMPLTQIETWNFAWDDRVQPSSVLLFIFFVMHNKWSPASDGLHSTWPHEVKLNFWHRKTCIFN
jgi:hypothetical protein